MKKLTLIISIFLVAMTSCHSGKQFLDNAAPEERALNIMKVTDEEKTTVLMPEVRSGFPKNFATTRWSGNKNNGIHWGCNKLLSASPDGDEIAYMTAENKQTNIMIRRTTANGSATQRTFRDVTDFSWGGDGKLYFSGEGISVIDAHVGSLVRQLTNNESDCNPTVTDDGKLLFFSRFDRTGPSIWSLNLENGALTQCAVGYEPCTIGNNKEAFVCVRNNTSGCSEIWLVDFVKGQETIILSDKNIKDRDDQTIHLENAKKGIFNPMVKNISTLRSAFSTDGIILASALASDTTINYKALYNEASKKYQSQLEKLHNYDNYQECVAAINTQDPYERVLNMRALLMHASRQGSGGVMNLFGYTAQDLEWIVGPLMPMVKEVMPGEIAKLPQYYGFSTLIDLASQNVEQFLDLSAKMYELLVAKKISDPSHYVLTAEEQDGIIRGFAKNRLEDIKRLPRGNKIYGFLMHLIDFCREVTFTPSYSYRSVTGFAVKEENSGKWGKDGFWFQEEANDELSTILKDCLSYNFLMKQGITQGKKDQKWTIFYLNSWLCAYAHLPLERGGWRPLTLHKLNSWL